MTSSLFIPLTFALTLALLGGHAWSQTDAPIEEVAVIATRIEQPVTDLAGNVTVLDSEQLERVSAVHLQQAMSQIPGVSMQRGNGQESLPAIRSAVPTGAGACGSFLVMEEGIPVRGAGFCNVNELFDTHFEQSDRLEVVRGANTAFYGSNALNGSVNTVLTPYGDDAVALELGANSYTRAKAAFSYQNQSSSQGRVFATVTDDGGYRDDSGYQQQKFSWRHQQAVRNWQLQAGATFTDLDQDTAGFITGKDSYRDRDLARQNLDPEAFRQTRSVRAWLKLDGPVNEVGTLSATVYLRDTDMDFLQHFLPGDPLEQNAQTGVGWQSALRMSLANEMVWSVGIDGEISEGELRQSQDEPTEGSAFLQETVPVGLHYDYQVDATQLALFTHLDWQWRTDWQLLAGARLETIRYDYDNLMLTGRTRDDGSECGFGGCRYSRPADRTDRFTHLSPKLELRYMPNERWRFSMIATDSFRAPQATELYRLQREQSVADLDTVKARSLEASLRYLTNSLKLDLSVYYQQNDNVIIRDSDFFNIDGQSTRSRGMELSFTHSLNERWRWRAVGSLAEHQYTSNQLVDDVNINGNMVDTAPKAFGSLFLEWRQGERLSVEWELQHMGAYYLEPTNQYRYPGHTLVHARAAYQLNEHWGLSFRALNLADRRYAERADFTSFTEERYFPGEPRSLFAELRYVF